MDPPAVRKAATQQAQRSASGFPSPTQDHASINPKFVDDCTRMNFAIQQSLPEAVRRIVRDHWEKCLLGSEFHQAFLLNASIHHAVPSVTQRAIRDFGRKMVAESKKELIAHFTTEDLDEVADIIIAKASDRFLDKCLEKRLLTIEAKPLINALAKAERLGYEPGDIVQDDQHERVIPQEAFPGATTAANGYPAPPAPAPAPTPAYPQPAQQVLQCMKCFRTFAQTSAYDYHTRYNVCQIPAPTVKGFEHSCPHCGQGAISLDDLQAHLDKKLCGYFPDLGRVPAPRGPGRPPKVTPAHPQTPAPAVSSMTTTTQSPAHNGHSSTEPRSTPVHTSITTRKTASVATPAADPYAHLSEKQIEAMNEELKLAEEKYAPRFKEAEQIPDENLRRMRIEGLRNSFGTKQSMIRKKYGVRLRERRTKAEIQAERERLGLKKAEKESKRSSSVAQQQHGSSPAVNTEPVGRASGWTAANVTGTPRPNWGEDHEAKRRRTDETGGYRTPFRSLTQEDTPTRKTLPDSEPGAGLADSPATAATRDPTLLPPASSNAPPSSHPVTVYKRGGVRVEIHEPAASDSGRLNRGSPSSGTTNGTVGRRSSGESAEQERAPVVVVDDDDSSSDDDEDIPSTLPTHVRRSLAGGGAGVSGSGSTSLLQT
ncbi:hypothetical protein VTI74DRAFT_2552 [Chaetomium olivicolor]